MSYDAATLAALERDAAEVKSRYPQARSALLPLLHLVQSVDSYISPDGVAFCASQLDLAEAEVSAVATFYSQFKRQPNGTYTLGVCVTALCAVMGGDAIYKRLSQYLGIGHEQTTLDGRFTLERVECNAACDYAPVMMVNWEFFDNQTPDKAVAVVADLAAGRPVKPSRGPDQVPTFQEVSRTLAGFSDGLADQGPSGGQPSRAGLAVAAQRGWTAPAYPPSSAPATVPAAAAVKEAK